MFVVHNSCPYVSNFFVSASRFPAFRFNPCSLVALLFKNLRPLFSCGSRISCLNGAGKFRFPVSSLRFVKFLLSAFKISVFTPPFALFLKINAPQTPRVYWRKPQFDRLCCPATCNFQNLCQNCLVRRKTTSVRTCFCLPPQAAPSCAHRASAFALYSALRSSVSAFCFLDLRFQVSGDSASTGSPKHRLTEAPKYRSTEAPVHQPPTPNPPIP